MNQPVRIILVALAMLMASCDPSSPTTPLLVVEPAKRQPLDPADGLLVVVQAFPAGSAIDLSLRTVEGKFQSENSAGWLTSSCETSNQTVLRYLLVKADKADGVLFATLRAAGDNPCSGEALDSRALVFSTSLHDAGQKPDAGDAGADGLDAGAPIGSQDGGDDGGTGGDR